MLLSDLIEHLMGLNGRADVSFQHLERTCTVRTQCMMGTMISSTENAEPLGPIRPAAPGRRPGVNPSRCEQAAGVCGCGRRAAVGAG